jgi:uncharacterized protein (DUF1330 family)
MAAYVIYEVEVLDEDSFEQYRSRAQISIEQHGGRYLPRHTRRRSPSGIGR